MPAKRDRLDVICEVNCKQILRGMGAPESAAGPIIKRLNEGMGIILGDQLSFFEALFLMYVRGLMDGADAADRSRREQP